MNKPKSYYEILRKAYEKGSEDVDEETMYNLATRRNESMPKVCTCHFNRNPKQF